ncbi:MAG: hypothetical protein DMF89_14390, partial [Acidobacteria bacterium]
VQAAFFSSLLVLPGAPGPLYRDPEVLREIGRRFGGQLALNAAIERAGRISVGDTVTLVRPPATPTR